MSSLQKFHRRTNNVPSGPVTWPPSVIGMGDDSHGYWVGTAGDNTSKLIIAPKTAETTKSWSTAANVTTYAQDINDGIANTNTLNSSAYAAYYCKTYSLGGYNTWYMPAYNELYRIYANRNSTPFSTNNGVAMFVNWWSSTEQGFGYAYGAYFSGGASPTQVTPAKSNTAYIRPVRRIV